MTAHVERPLAMTARTPADLLAVIPVLLGFTPAESIVMLTFGIRRPFHARLDLPRGPEPAAQLEEAVRLLLEPALHHAVPRVVLVVYSDDRALATNAAVRLRTDFEAAGVEVVEALRTDGRRWWPAGEAWPGFPPDGVPYDPATHPITAEAVVAGRPVLASREELERSVALDPALAAGVVAALADPPPVEVEDADHLDVLVGRLVEEYAASGAVPADTVIAGLVRAVLEPAGRDAAAARMSRRTAEGHVGLWTEVVRRCPDPLVAGPAALLALAAWRAGDGARAWCAVERCFEAAPDDTLGHLVATALSRAVPPPDDGPDDHSGRPGDPPVPS